MAAAGADRTWLAVLMVVALLLPGMAALAGGTVYYHEDKYGRKSFSDQPLPGKSNMTQLELTVTKGWVERPLGAAASAGGKRGAGAAAYDWKKNQQRFDAQIRQLATEFSVPRTLIHAVITAESSYDPNAVSKAGAVGLMQLMPETASDYGVRDRRDPQQNMRAGVRHLRYLLGLFNDNLKLALAAYNAGERAVIRYGHRIPPYRETQRYVRKVLDYYQLYNDSRHALSRL